MKQQAKERSITIQIRPEKWIAAVQEAWRSAGYRMTEPRNRVLHYIASYSTPFSAEQLYADLQQESLAPGRATVYRALEQLSSEGWVVRVHLNNIESGYSVSWPGHFHHLICTACGKVVAFEGCELEHMLDNLKRQTRFTIDGHLLEIYGHCSDCSGFSAS